MKKLLFVIMFLASLMSCDKEFSKLELSEVIPGGCALEKGFSAKNTFLPGTDEVTYTIVNGDLVMFVGFNATCCGVFSASAEIEGETIIIKIIEEQPGHCNCICYYTYNFEFEGSGEHFKYKVTVDNYLTFNGEIKP